MKVNIAGTVPKQVASAGLKSLVDMVRQGYVYFRRDEEVDQLERRVFTEGVRNRGGEMSSQEQQILFRSLKYADLRLVGGRISKWESVAGVTKTNSSKKLEWRRIQTSTTDATDTTKKFSKYAEGDALIWCKASAVVHASIEECAGWVWGYCSWCRMIAHQRKGTCGVSVGIVRPGFCFCFCSFSNC